jgi:hypothetical protein
MTLLLEPVPPLILVLLILELELELQLVLVLVLVMLRETRRMLHQGEGHL